MENFTRFEYQYIIMLSIRARQGLLEVLEGGHGEIDPNIKGYIDSLETIANKAKLNMAKVKENE